MTRLLRRQSRRQVSGWSRYRKGRPVRRRVDAALTLASPVRMSVAVAAAAHRATFGVVMTAKEKLRVAVEELSETEAAEALGYIASESTSTANRYRTGGLGGGSSVSSRSASQPQGARLSKLRICSPKDSVADAASRHRRAARSGRS
jgi:hypothetical protein